MHEFLLIERFFKSITHHRQDVIFGIGDDAACLHVASDHVLLVSTDTLVADVHFLSDWDAYDIAYRAVMVNVSDMVAMAAFPCWITLALTLPKADIAWLERFSTGLQDALQRFNIALVGGDTTKGPLSITLTIQGQVLQGKAVRRGTAKPGDIIYVSGDLGAAALAIACLQRTDLDPNDRAILMKKLQRPEPRIDLVPILQQFATAAIDISDGLGADLQHICTLSGVGACLEWAHIPIHPLVKKYQGTQAVDFSLNGGDDYEICFTVSPLHQQAFLACLDEKGLCCTAIGIIESTTGLRALTEERILTTYHPLGYRHFN